MPPPPDVIAAGLILRRATAQGWLWLLLCNQKRGEWGFPKGHAEPGEGAEATALRECAEETGIGLLTIERPPWELLYRLSDQRTKRVIYFAAVTSQSAVVLSPEHSRSEWCVREEVLRRLAHDNVRNLFRAAACMAESAGPRR